MRLHGTNTSRGIRQIDRSWLIVCSSEDVQFITVHMLIPRALPSRCSMNKSFLLNQNPARKALRLRVLLQELSTRSMATILSGVRSSFSSKSAE